MHYEPADAERDMPAIARLISHAFGATREDAEAWIRESGVEHERVVRDRAGETADAVVACLLRIPMGQYFGGRRVRMLGVAGVATAPEVRGRGHAAAMMTLCVREARADGFPLTALYASTQSLYRKVGYEQAGHRMIVTVPLSRIDVREREPALVPLPEGDLSRAKACYGAFAPRFDGMLDRGPYCWGRVEEWRGDKYTGFGVPAAGGGLDGYAYLTQRRKADDGRHDVVLSDVAFLTPAAGRRLLGFFADFATIGNDLVFAAGPAHPLLFLLGQQKYSMKFTDFWMLRIADVPAALEARGYAPGVSASVHLDVTDTVIPENAGRWIVTVEGGRARAQRGGRGDVRMDVRALASAYTGFLSPRALALTGQMEGDDAALDALGAIFGGRGLPWMTDFF